MKAREALLVKTEAKKPWLNSVACCSARPENARAIAAPIVQDSPLFQSKRFLECVEDSFLTQLVREPTRGGALLDLLFANKEGLVGDVKVGDCLGQSDHEIVEFSILGDVRRVTTKTAILNLKRADFDLLRTLVARVPWESLLKGKGVQEAWTLLKMEILKAQKQAVPEYCKASHRGRRPVWMSRELLSRLRKKKRVHVLWKKGQATRGDYKEVAKELTKKLSRMHCRKAAIPPCRSRTVERRQRQQLARQGTKFFTVKGTESPRAAEELKRMVQLMAPKLQTV
ncbi:uncharacterized protein LOC125685961 [Lagopus muta]|uniref:uncharacterized protein LOC125685961 n=1 Tax=Lagopus muta TaxID=64668 RepID=UPI00209EC629|nr:uncharacterized protein LOC125685961 [Lagopus muta]